MALAEQLYFRNATRSKGVLVVEREHTSLIRCFADAGEPPPPADDFCCRQLRLMEFPKNVSELAKPKLMVWNSPDQRQSPNQCFAILIRRRGKIRRYQYNPQKVRMELSERSADGRV